MTNTAPKTEIEKLGPDYKSLIARSLVAAAVVVSMVAVPVQVNEYLNTERTEISELSYAAKHLDALQQHIKFDTVKTEANRATDFDNLKTMFQMKKVEVDEKIEQTGFAGKLLNQHETRAERSAQYDNLINEVNQELKVLESKGIVPFKVLAQRRADLENSIDNVNMSKDFGPSPL